MKIILENRVRLAVVAGYVPFSPTGMTVDAQAYPPYEFSDFGFVK
ncbi:hypothetical protein [Sedimenticola hydrogenitrophicus]|nr:hypothetical protein [Sedimenticola hydrogenitrophicus]